MSTPSPDPPLPRLPADLVREADRGPLERRLLAAPTAGTGRELLRAPGRHRGGWSGFAVTTPRPLAVQLAAGRLSDEGLEILDPFGEDARIDDALDAALEEDAGTPFADSPTRRSVRSPATRGPRTTARSRTASPRSSIPSSNSWRGSGRRSSGPGRRRRPAD